jgi:hypothetical protein
VGDVLSVFDGFARKLVRIGRGIEGKEMPSNSDSKRATLASPQSDTSELEG